MMQDSPDTYLNRLGNSATYTRNIRVIGLAEAEAKNRLMPFAQLQNPRLELYSKEGEMLVRLTARGTTQEQAAAITAPVVKKICGILGSAVYGVDVDSLQDVVVGSLKQQGLRIATAESCTGGLLSQYITNVPGASKVFEFGVSAYANHIKVKKLGVSPKLLTKHGAISSETAIAMAMGARKQGKADIGVGITGNAGPTADEEKPVGLVYIAICDGKSAWVKTLRLGQGGTPSREFIRSMAVRTALNMVRMYLHYYDEILPDALPLPGAGGKLSMLLAGFGGARVAKNKLAKNRSSQEDDALKKNRKKPLGRRIYERFIPMRSDTKMEVLRKAIFMVAMVVFIGSMVYIASVFGESADNKKRSEDLSNVFENGGGSVEDYPKEYLAKFEGLYAINEDIAGWVKIPNTQVNYAVVQSTDNIYYERKDFDRNDNQHGIPFVDYKVDLKAPSTNTIIYAHNMNDGQMFGELMNYKSLKYYQEHPMVQFDSVYKERKYKIVGVVIARADDPEFLYHMFVDSDADGLTKFVNQVRERSLIHTTVDVRTDDKLLTLSTCDYSFPGKTARFVVIARELRPGESETIDVAGAKLNTNPKMPAEWYSEVARKQQAELEAQKKKEEEEKQKGASAWLTEDEMVGLNATEIAALVERRKTELAQWLTPDEMSTLSAAKKLELMQKRQEEAQNKDAINKKWLTSEDIANLTQKQKDNKIAENQALARKWLSESEINSVTTWAEVKALIEQKKAQGEISAADEAKWLIAAERGYTIEEKIQLIASRKAEATKYNVDPARYNTWPEISAAIEKAKKEQATPTADEKKWLSDGEFAYSATEKAQLMDARKAEAAKYKVDHSKYTLWKDLSAAIEKAKQAQAGPTAEEKKWLSDGEFAYGATEKTQLIDARKAEAAKYKVDHSKYTLWKDLSAAIEKAKQASSGGSSTAPPPDPGSSSSGGSSSSSTPPPIPPESSSSGGSSSSDTPPPIPPESSSSSNSEAPPVTPPPTTPETPPATT